MRSTSAKDPPHYILPNSLVRNIIISIYNTVIDIIIFDGISFEPSVASSLLLPIFFCSLLLSYLLIIFSLNSTTIIVTVSSFLETMLTCKRRYRAIFCWFTISDAEHQYHIGNITSGGHKKAHLGLEGCHK